MRGAVYNVPGIGRRCESRRSRRCNARLPAAVLAEPAGRAVIEPSAELPAEPLAGPPPDLTMRRPTASPRAAGIDRPEPVISEVVMSIHRLFPVASFGAATQLRSIACAILWNERSIERLTELYTLPPTAGRSRGVLVERLFELLPGSPYGDQQTVQTTVQTTGQNKVQNNRQDKPGRDKPGQQQVHDVTGRDESRKATRWTSTSAKPSTPLLTMMWR